MSVWSKCRRLTREAAILPIRGYQHLFSAGTPPRCIYTPTCSHYTAEAIRLHGVLRGGLAGLFRVLRCTGLLFEGGFDPVSERAPLRAVLRGYRAFFRFRRAEAQAPSENGDEKGDGTADGVSAANERSDKRSR